MKPKQSKKEQQGKTMLFVSAGKEKIRKGVIYLERALPAIFDKYPVVNLVHVGSKFEWNVPKKYKKRIISVGRVPWDKMTNYFSSSTFFISTSLQEGFPNVLLEAMLAGCPIISSNIEGIHEYITHKKSGYIFEKGNVKELIKGIEYMLNNEEKLSFFRQNSKEKIKRLKYPIYSKELLNFLHDKKTRNLLEK